MCQAVTKQSHRQILPIELYWDIIRKIRNIHHPHHSSWRSETHALLNLATVSRALGDIARSVLYEKVNLVGHRGDGDSGGRFRLFQRTLSSSEQDLGSLVHKITIRVFSVGDRDADSHLVPLILQHLTSLRSLKLSFPEDRPQAVSSTLILACAPTLQEFVANFDISSELVGKFIKQVPNLRFFSNSSLSWSSLPLKGGFTHITALELTYDPSLTHWPDNITTVRHLSLLVRHTVIGAVRLPPSPRLVSLRLQFKQLSYFHNDVLPIRNMPDSLLIASENNVNIDFLWVEAEYPIIDTRNIGSAIHALPGSWSNLRTLIWSVPSDADSLDALSSSSATPNLKKLLGRLRSGFHWTESEVGLGGVTQSRQQPRSYQVLPDCWRADELDRSHFSRSLLEFPY